MLRKNIKYIAFFAVIFYIIILYKLDIHCPFYAVFGVPCPTCGITRGFISLVRLDFADSFLYHPLAVLAPFIVMLILMKRTKLTDLLLISISVLFLVVYVIRLCTGFQFL